MLDEFLPPETADENEWYGAWNVLLNKYFPIDEGWVVIVNPQVEKSYSSVDFGFLFKVERQRM